MNALEIPSKEGFIDSSKNLLIIGAGAAASTAATALTLKMINGSGFIDPKSAYTLLGISALISGIVVNANAKDSDFIKGIALGLTSTGIFTLVVGVIPSEYQGS